MKLNRRHFCSALAIGSAGVVGGTASAQPVSAQSEIQKVTKNPDSGFHFPYYLYTPPIDQVTNSGNSRLDSINPRPLLVMFVTWDSESERVKKLGEDMDASGHLEEGSARAIADILNIPALVALLPDGTPDGEFEVLNRGALQISEPPYNRLDLQLFSMVDDAKRRLAEQPYDIADKIHLEGFSSNGLLCSQLSMLHPERINAVSSGGSGAYPIPKSEYQDDIPVQSEPETTTLEWPVGIADLPDLIGKEFNKNAWLDISKYCYIGSNDQGNPDKSDLVNEYRRARSWDDFTPSRKRRQLLYDIFGWEHVDERFTTSRRIYETVGANATFKIYDGVGHNRTNRILNNIADFHREQMISEFPTGNIQSSEGTEATDSAPSNESSAEQSESTTDTQPGFGIGSGIAALGATGYMLRRRLTNDSE